MLYYTFRFPCGIIGPLVYAKSGTEAKNLRCYGLILLIWSLRRSHAAARGDDSDIFELM